ncbi:hypothetical protein GOP47_0017121 [Adiantum capillus-veneris]|uniref:Uncharacterized protein n=1 Tax=Adiantum capillus-veneris TaxID=13818 RepID=A0A9D4UJX3_ADICA|nr:hypothetical protein GOP47_0017121 [Adiantum capillus-veneris]
MGTCCSKIDNPHEVCSFNGDLHPSLEQWQAGHSSCQFCRANGVAGHLQFCPCESCQRAAASPGIKGFSTSSSFREPMCSLCVADVFDAHFLRQAAPCVSSRSMSGFSDEVEKAPHYDLSCRRSDYPSKHALDKRPSSGKHAIMQGDVEVHAYKQEILSETCAFKHNFLRTDHDCDLPEPNDGLHSSETLSSSLKEDYDACSGYDVAYEIPGNSRRLSNIDDSDGIKLEVRYKHMLPHDAHLMASICTSPHDVNVLKRGRPQEEPLITGDPEANRSIRRRKSFRITGADEEDGSFERSLRLIDCEDELGNDDDFHDFHVNISSCLAEKDQHQDAELCYSLEAFSLSHGNAPIRDLQARGSPDHVDGFGRPDLTGTNQQPLYIMSQENLQFINRKEREWEERAHEMGMADDKISSKMPALSLVSTGDAILFSGANSDELHLIPSVTVQHPKSPLSSPKQKLSPLRIASPERPYEQVAGNSPLSIENIIHLLENEELSGDDLFLLLIDSCMKSSASSSPSSSAESTNSWSSPLSSSSSTSSTSVPSMPPSSLPMSSTSELQSAPACAVMYSPTPYSLSLPPSCKMSPHTSFEFKVKSCGSTPSTPVFSPIRSRTKRNISHLKPNSLTADEITEIWGVFEQRQAFMSQQHVHN